ncbi:hypothetical protein PIB30_008895 [Stylosanthes scabra]|uniref:Non-specific lipid-transfer protein n=1 Tax=Stylosanthes scabra TaxID=79078 RepID=A0ABU6Q4Y3_9FABA|nr:hypothetical protein [Stylosanthes scabra]
MASIKVSCIVLMVCMALVAAPMVHGAISCGTVTSSMASCLEFLQAGGVPAPSCCQGVKSLLKSAQTTPDRRTVCSCLKTAAASIPTINLANAGQLPGKCGVNIPYKISPSTNCATIN